MYKNVYFNLKNIKWHKWKISEYHQEFAFKSQEQKI